MGAYRSCVRTLINQCTLATENLEGTRAYVKQTYGMFLDKWNYYLTSLKTRLSGYESLDKDVEVKTFVPFDAELFLNALKQLNTHIIALKSLQPLADSEFSAEPYVKCGLKYKSIYGTTDSTQYGPRYDIVTSKYMEGGAIDYTYVDAVFEKMTVNTYEVVDSVSTSLLRYSKTNAAYAAEYISGDYIEGGPMPSTAVDPYSTRTGYKISVRDIYNTTGDATDLYIVADSVQGDSDYTVYDTVPDSASYYQPWEDVIYYKYENDTTYTRLGKFNEVGYNTLLKLWNAGTLRVKRYKRLIFTNAVVVNARLYSVGSTPFYVYYPGFDWSEYYKEKQGQLGMDMELSCSKMWRGWFGTGESGWSKDLEDLQDYTYLNKLGWTKRGLSYAKEVIAALEKVSEEDALYTVNNATTAKVLFQAGNLLAVKLYMLQLIVTILYKIYRKGKHIK